METLNIDKEKAINAYQQGSEEQKKFLELLFGVETFRPKNVIERVKTFEDACRELGKDHPFVLAYQNTNLRDPEVADDNIEVLAYMKLRVICKALNEGWEPQFTEGEERWNPVFLLWSKEELSLMSDDQKAKRHLIDRYLGDWAGFSYSVSENVIESYVSNCASRLCLKSQQLADYCGKQFVNLWADFFLTKK